MRVGQKAFLFNSSTSLVGFAVVVSAASVKHGRASLPPTSSCLTHAFRLQPFILIFLGKSYFSGWDFPSWWISLSLLHPVLSWWPSTALWRILMPTAFGSFSILLPVYQVQCVQHGTSKQPFKISEPGNTYLRRWLNRPRSWTGLLKITTLKCLNLETKYDWYVDYVSSHLLIYNELIKINVFIKLLRRLPGRQRMNQMILFLSFLSKTCHRPIYLPNSLRCALN